MKAWRLHRINDIRLEDIKTPVPTAGEILLSVKACGICGSDIPRIYSTGAHRMPLIPGHEFSGEVIQAGSGEDSAWIGKRVGVFPLIPCQACPSCQQTKYELCSHYDYLGSRRDGAFSEFVTVPVWNLLELPDSVSYESAAMLEPMAVAVHAMRRVPLDTAGTILIYGAGTVGMLLAMFLLEQRQYKLLVVGNKEFQKNTLMETGLPAGCFCDSTTMDVPSWVQMRTNGFGADIVFECVGKNDTISQILKCVNREGHICMVGNPHSDVFLKKDIYWNILRKELTVSGTWNSSFKSDVRDDWRYVINKLECGRIHPQNLITHRLSIEHLEDGLHIMRDKTQHYTKIIMTRESRS